MTERKNSATSSTHHSLGYPYTPSRPDHSSSASTDRHPWKDSADSSPCSLNSKEAHWLETPESTLECTSGALGRFSHCGLEDAGSESATNLPLSDSVSVLFIICRPASNMFVE